MLPPIPDIPAALIAQQFCSYGYYNSLETALYILDYEFSASKHYAFPSFTFSPISQHADLPIVDIQYTYNNLLLQNMISNLNFKSMHLNTETLHALMHLIN